MQVDRGRVSGQIGEERRHTPGGADPPQAVVGDPGPGISRDQEFEPMDQVGGVAEEDGALAPVR